MKQLQLYFNFTHIFLTKLTLFIFYPDFIRFFHGFSGKNPSVFWVFFWKKSCKKKATMRFWRSTNLKKISIKNKKITILLFINRLWFRVPHGLSGAFIRHYTSRPLVLPYLRSLRPHKWLHLASTSTYWVSNGILFRKLFWPTVRKNCPSLVYLIIF